MEITDAIRSHVEDKTAKLPRYYNNINRIEIYNQVNQLVFTKLAYGEPFVSIYSLPKLKKGIYFLKIYGDKKQDIKKVIVN